MTVRADEDDATGVSGDCDEDGVVRADDCNDADATDVALSGDCDEDGVFVADDCNDADDAIGTAAVYTLIVMALV